MSPVQRRKFIPILISLGAIPLFAYIASHTGLPQIQIINGGNSVINDVWVSARSDKAVTQDQFVQELRPGSEIKWSFSGREVTIDYLSFKQSGTMIRHNAPGRVLTGEILNLTIDSSGRLSHQSFFR